MNLWTSAWCMVLWSMCINLGYIVIHSGRLKLAKNQGYVWKSSPLMASGISAPVLGHKSLSIDIAEKKTAALRNKRLTIEPPGKIWTLECICGLFLQLQRKFTYSIRIIENFAEFVLRNWTLSSLVASSRLRSFKIPNSGKYLTHEKVADRYLVILPCKVINHQFLTVYGISTGSLPASFSWARYSR